MVFGRLINRSTSPSLQGPVNVSTKNKQNDQNKEGKTVSISHAFITFSEFLLQRTKEMIQLSLTLTVRWVPILFGKIEKAIFHRKRQPPKISWKQKKAVLYKQDSCLTLAISYFVLLSQPLSVPCLFEKVHWEGKRLFSKSQGCTVRLKEV